MITKKTYQARRKKLAAFLKALPTKKFNITNWTWSQNSEKPCGTAACAIGWCPHVFPRDWTINTVGNPQLLDTDWFSPFTQAGRFFGLCLEDSEVIFGIHDSHTPTEAPVTAKQVADKLLAAAYLKAFVKPERQ